MPARIGLFPAGDKPADVKVYDLGKRVLGRSAGGIITNLRKRCRFDDHLATQILLEAEGKSDPKAWISKRLRSVDDLVYRGVDGHASDGLPPLKTKADMEYEAWEAAYYASVH